jgi:hypothetical protein
MVIRLAIAGSHDAGKIQKNQSFSSDPNDLDSLATGLYHADS